MVRPGAVVQLGRNKSERRGKDKVHQIKRSHRFDIKAHRNQPSKKQLRKYAEDLRQRREEREAERLLEQERETVATVAVKLQGLQAQLAAVVAETRKVLEDDEDIAQLDALADQGGLFLHQGLVGLDAAKDKPLRAEATGRATRRTSADDFADGAIDAANIAYLAAFRVIQVIKATFPLTSGGFGAKGRAHAIPAKVGGTDADHPVADASFLSDIEIGGTKLSSVASVAKASLTNPDEAVGPLVTGADDIVGVEGRIAALNPGNAAWRIDYKGTPVGKDRGLGQLANMGNTNAAGYAALAALPGYASQRWEWLHVRAASLGGATDGTNLVAGTRDANTHMIPFENNVRALASAVGKHSDKFHYLRAHWGVEGQHDPAKHAVDAITLQWTLEPKADPSLKRTGKAKFKPLATGSNISKTEVDLIEEALKLARGGLPE